MSRFSLLVRDLSCWPNLLPTQVVTAKAQALYDYTPDNADELPLTEGEIVTIIDKSEEEWWKAERDGKVLVVPCAYLAPLEG
jgi:actin cytoskeleton-regulatory complex protein PAN1